VSKIHFVIYGVGAVGGFYGAQLQAYAAKSEEFRVSFVARGQTFIALKNQGIKLICRNENFGKIEENIIIEKNLTVYEKFSEIKLNPQEYTVVLLCVKSRDTISSCEDIAKNLNDNLVVVSVQNGIDNENKIASVIGIEKTIGCLTNVAAEVLEPGIYIQKGTYGLVLGELEKNKGLVVIYEAMKAAGVVVKISDNIMKDLWSKLVWNAAFNPISVRYQANIGQILTDPERKKRVENIMAEVIKVANAENIDIGPEVAHKHIERTSALDWADFKTSMLQDFEKNKAIEIDELLGIIIKLGNEHNIATPHAKALYEELTAKLC
jgi:2-dehydropantoate 2-reductase